MEQGIYKITCLANGRFYIGSAVNFRERWNRHLADLRNCRHSNKHLERAWQKYGADCFTFQIVEVVLDKAELVRREQIWLDHTKACDFGFNQCRNAGRNPSGLPVSAETRAKLSAANRRRVFTPENRAKLSAARKGKKFTDEQKRRLALAKANMSQETKDRMSAARKAYRPTEETKAKQSASLKGHSVSEETRRKIGEANRKKQPQTTQGE